MNYIRVSIPAASRCCPVVEPHPDGRCAIYATSVEAACLGRREYDAGRLALGETVILIPDAEEADRRRRLQAAADARRDQQIAAAVEADRLCRLARARGATSHELYSLRCDMLYAALAGYSPRLAPERRAALTE